MVTHKIPSETLCFTGECLNTSLWTASRFIFKSNYSLQGDYDDTKLVKTNKHTYKPVSLANIFPNYLPWI